MTIVRERGVRFRRNSPIDFAKRANTATLLSLGVHFLTFEKQVPRSISDLNIVI